MPPYELWLRGPDEIARWMLGPGSRCRGSRMLPTAAERHARLRAVPPEGGRRGHEAGALHVLEISGGRIVG